MTIIDELRRLALFVVLSLAQVLVFNHIHLFGYATLLLLVYFVVTFPRNYPRWAMLLWSFFLGLFADLFSNTPGMAGLPKPNSPKRRTQANIAISMTILIP